MKSKYHFWALNVNIFSINNNKSQFLKSEHIPFYPGFAYKLNEEFV